jgi:hypothetical protein
MHWSKKDTDSFCITESKSISYVNVKIFPNQFLYFRLSKSSHISFSFVFIFTFVQNCVSYMCYNDQIH